MSTAENMTKLRKALFLNKQQMANALGISISAISGYERGIRQPSYATVKKIMQLAKQNKIKLSFDDVRADEVKPMEQSA